MGEARPKYQTGNDEAEDAAEMMGWKNQPPRQIVTEISGFYPLYETVIAHYNDYTTAVVFGCMWRFMQMVDGVCKASLDTIGEATGMDKSTVSRHITKLVADGYVIDLTPNLRNRPHVYADGGRVVMKQKQSAEAADGVAQSNTKKSRVAQSNVTVAQSNTGVAKSDLNKVLNKDSNKGLGEPAKPLSKEKALLLPDEKLITMKDQFTEEEWTWIVNQRDVEKTGKTITAAYERAMGYNPLSWSGKLERLKKFLLTKQEAEIRQFAEWSKAKYSPLSPAKARLNPDMVVDLWPQAFTADPADNPYRNLPTVAELEAAGKI